MISAERPETRNTLGSPEVGLARPHELTEIWELYRDIWLDTYPNEDFGLTRQDVSDYLESIKEDFLARWENAISSPGPARTVFVARMFDRVVGMVSPKITRDCHELGDCHHLTSLYVAPEVRGMGVGSDLLATALDWHGENRVNLFVAPYLENAQRLYAKNGFGFVNQNLVYFDDSPIPHLLMSRPA